MQTVPYQFVKPIQRSLQKSRLFLVLVSWYRNGNEEFCWRKAMIVQGQEYLIAVSPKLPVERLLLFHGRG